MVTSSAVVGSSAMMMSGIAAHAHGDHDPLPHAAAELVRIALQSPRGSGMLTDSSNDTHFSSSVGAADSCAARAARRAGGRWCRTGLRLVIGSWKIMAMRLPRISRIPLRAARSKIATAKMNLAAGDAAGRIGDQTQAALAPLHSCRNRSRLPGPESRRRIDRTRRHRQR